MSSFVESSTYTERVGGSSEDEESPLLSPKFEEYLDAVEDKPEGIRDTIHGKAKAWIATGKEYLKHRMPGPKRDTEKRPITFNVNERNGTFASNKITTSKYTLTNFFPKFIKGEYRKVSNAYFTIVVLVQWIPGISPIVPISSVFPLLFVLGIAFIREILEDFHRHMADRRANNSSFLTITGGGEGEAVGTKYVSSQQLRVGDVAKIFDGDLIPADVLMLSSSNSDGACFVTTASLDGETNLKKLKALDDTAVMGGDQSALARFRARVTCSPPDPLFEEFRGVISFKSVPTSAASIGGSSENSALEMDVMHQTESATLSKKALSKDQLLLRGSRLQNTEFIYGVVTYTGVDTKMFLNLAPPPSKFGLLDRKLNTLVLQLLALQGVIILFCAIWSVVWNERVAVDHWYLGENQYGPVVLFIRNCVTYFILFNIFVPISLWVGLEVARLGQSKFMEWDNEMRSPDKKRHMTAKTSALNEDLGQIQIVFADKTGTLTANRMVFRQASVGGRVYGSFKGMQLVDDEADFIGSDDEDETESPGKLAKTYQKFKSLGKTAFKVKTAIAGQASRGNCIDHNVHIAEDELTGLNDLAFPTPPFGPLADPILSNSSMEQDGLANSAYHEGDGEQAYVMLQHMALCHSVSPEINPASGKVSYRTPSPDEKALVEGARDNGVMFFHRTDTTLTLWEHGSVVSYDRLAEIPFNSDRKRMSVVVRDRRSGEVALLTKGADNVMKPLLQEGQPLLEPTYDHINEFAATGLRTLVMARRVVPPEEWADWLPDWEAAVQVQDEDGEAMAAAAARIEHSLRLVGASAIEDQLQHRVPETLEYLRNAGIKVWVLTGDKRETARYIAYSSKLIDRSMTLMTLAASTPEECGEDMKRLIRQYCSRDSKYRVYNSNLGYLWSSIRWIRSWITGADDYAFVPSRTVDIDEEGNIHAHVEAQQGREGKPLALLVDGATLRISLEHHPKKFLWLGRNCKSVVCCRVTPKQKAAVVAAVQESEGLVSLAIGDGANDVTMIQTARVGVGIFGKEGTQAARSSDYAIHQFKHLQRLLCVHGRRSYLRSSGLIQFSFYKNICFTLPFFFFAFSSGFSGQSLYDSWVISNFNGFFTNTMPVVYGMFERDLPDKLISAYPPAYRPFQSGKIFTTFTNLRWLISAFWHSFVIYFFSAMLALSEPWMVNGYTAGLEAIGMVASLAIILVVNLRMALEINNWNWVMNLGLWSTLVLDLVSFLPYGLLYGVPQLGLGPMFGVPFMVYGTPTFWIVLVMLIVFCLTLDFGIKYFWRQLYPEDTVILSEIYFRAKEKTRERQAHERAEERERALRLKRAQRLKSMPDVKARLVQLGNKSKEPRDGATVALGRKGKDPQE